MTSKQIKIKGFSKDYHVQLFRRSDDRRFDPSPDPHEQHHGADPIMIPNAVNKVRSFAGLGVAASFVRRGVR